MPTTRRGEHYEVPLEPFRKKRKTGGKEESGDPHANCKLHGDSHFRRTVCSAVKGSGERCTNKIKEIDQDSWNQGFLPVCKVHRNEKLRIGYCTATAKCGERCNRLCVLTPHLNQCCPTHKDTVFDCSLEKLPTELRLLIFEHLVPHSITAKHWEDKHPTVISLLQTNRLIHSDMQTLLYQSKERPCEAWLNVKSLAFFRRSWEVSPKAFHTQYSFERPLAQLYNSNFSNVRHLDVHIAAGKALDHDDDHLFTLMDMSRALLAALQILPIGSPDSKMPPCSSHKLDSLKVTFLFNDWETKRGYTIKELPKYIFAVVRAILHVWKIACAKVFWVIDYRCAGQTRMFFTPDESRMLSQFDNSVSKAAASFEHTRLKRWSQSELSARFAVESMQTWKVFRSVALMAADLVSLRIVSNDTGYKHYMFHARSAFETRNTEALELMVEDLRTLWKTYVESHTQVLQVIRARYVTEPAANVVDPHDLLKWTDSETSKELNWPPYRPLIRVAKERTEVVDYVYERATVQGKEVYRVISPDRMAQRRRLSMVEVPTFDI